MHGVESSKLEDAWTLYWRSGNTSSCVDGEADSAALRDSWHQFFARVKAGSTVLDLATGNGFVASTAAAVSRTHSLHLRIVGVDAAQISPAAIPEATFVSGVRMEALPFANQSVDAVVSQFGFEYGAREKCAAEAARVLKPGGQLRFIVHAHAGAVHQAISEQVARLEVVLKQDGVLTTLLSAAEAEADAARRVDAALAACWERSQSSLAGAPDEDAAIYYANGLTNLWRARHRYAPNDVQRSIDDAQRRAGGVLVRHKALLQAACSRTDCNDIGVLLHASGLTMREPSPINDSDDQQIAWLVEGVKRD